MQRKQKKNSDKLFIKVYNNEIESALKQFKRRVKESNLMVELKTNTFYEKPSTVRRRIMNMAKQRYSRE